MLTLTLLLVSAGLTAGSATAAGVDVNMDDPNMAYSNDYASDSAINCPSSLKGKKLKVCLAKNGAVGPGSSSEEISEDAELLSASTSTSVH